MSRYYFTHQDELRELIEEVFPGFNNRSFRANKILDEVINCLPKKLDENKISKKLNISKRWLQQECKLAYNTTYKRIKKLFSNTQNKSTNKTTSSSFNWDYTLQTIRGIQAQVTGTID